MGVMTGEELAKALSALYYKAGGFGGAASLHQRLPKGAASLARVKEWIASQQVGAYLQVHRAATQLYPPGRRIIPAA